MDGKVLYDPDKLYMSQSVEVRCPLSHTPLDRLLTKLHIISPIKELALRKRF